jgi:hypothetical protein
MDNIARATDAVHCRHRTGAHHHTAARHELQAEPILHMPNFYRTFQLSLCLSRTEKPDSMVSNAPSLLQHLPL